MIGSNVFGFIGYFFPFLWLGFRAERVRVMAATIAPQVNDVTLLR